jgi:hypothetical protein
VIAGTATTVNYTETTAMVANLPASLAGGDLLVLYTMYNYWDTNTPAGWVELTGDTGANVGTWRVFYKIASGSEGATVSWTASRTTQLEAVSLRITGASATPIQASAWSGEQAGSGTTIVDPSLTSTTANTLLIDIFSASTNAAVTISYNNGVTEAIKYAPNAGINWPIAVAYKALASPGSSGATTATITSSPYRDGVSLIVAP